MTKKIATISTITTTTIHHPSPSTMYHPSPSTSIVAPIMRSTAHLYCYQLLLLAAIIHSVIAHPNKDISHWIHQRCDEPSMWVFEGTLTDPTTGRTVAEVEGVELVAPLGFIDAKYIDGNEQLRGLAVKKLLCPTNDGNEWDLAGTILSRKLFCYKHHRSDKGQTAYTTPHGVAGEKELLTSIRLRPDGPIRRLSPSESVSVYDSAVTFVQRGNELLVFSESAGGEQVANQCAKSHVMGVAQPSFTGDGFEYTIYARKSSDNMKLPPVQSIDEARISPQRSRFVQFGKSEETKGYDAVRETYAYNLREDNINGNIQDEKQNSHMMKIPFRITNQYLKEDGGAKKTYTVRYTRYGEAPPWYAPGRMCNLDLIGRKIDMSIADEMNNNLEKFVPADQLPTVVKWSLGQCNPSFWSGWPSALCLTRKGKMYGKAIDLFCNEGSPSIHYDVHREQSKFRMLVKDAYSKLQSAAERLKQSLTYDDD
jgi:hypothetical protein